MLFFVALAQELAQFICAEGFDGLLFHSWKFRPLHFVFDAHTLQKKADVQHSVFHGLGCKPGRRHLVLEVAQHVVWSLRQRNFTRLGRVSRKH